ncbi:acyl-CoA dehydrogenase family protein [Bacillaceae bacterium W0354]
MNTEENIFLENDRQIELYQHATTISNQLKRYAKEADRTGNLLKQSIKLLKDYHYLSATLPEEYEGDHLSLYEWLIMQEKIAEGDGAAALSVGWHLGIIMELRSCDTWSYDQFDLLAREVMKQKLVNRASTEKNTGSPTRGGKPETIAVKEGDRYKINGRKTFTTAADHLDYALVSALVEEDDTIGWFLVDMKNDGVSIDRTWDTLGMRGTGSHDLLLKDVYVPETHFVEKEDGKKSASKGWLLHIPACYLGIAKAALDDTVHFANTFIPNSLDHPISKEANVRQKIGEMKLLLMRSRHLLYALAKKWDEHPEQRSELEKQLSIVKVSITNDVNTIVDLAMRVAGGRGLFKSNNFERYFRDARAGLHNPPLDDVVLEQLAANVLDT